MKLSNLNEWLSVTANVGVLAGIVFLAIEISQNNELMEAEARFNRLSLTTDSNNLIITQPDLADLLADVNANVRPLSPGEENRVRNLSLRLYKNQQWTYFELPLEMLPIEEWRDIAKLRWWVMNWDDSKHRFDNEFVEFIDETIIGH